MMQGCKDGVGIYRGVQPISSNDQIEPDYIVPKSRR